MVVDIESSTTFFIFCAQMLRDGWVGVAWLAIHWYVRHLSVRICSSGLVYVDLSMVLAK